MYELDWPQLEFFYPLNYVHGINGGDEGNSIVVCVSTRERDSLPSSTLMTSVKFLTEIFPSHAAAITSFEPIQLPLQYPSHVHTYMPD